MADEAREPTRENPPRQQHTAQKSQQSQQSQSPVSGQSQPRRQHDDRPRYHPPRNRPPQHNQQQPRPAVPAQEPADEKEVGLDDEDTEAERASQPQRGRGHRGRPEKKKYEEFINDPYCE